jgi:hypothetical protein
VLCRSAWPFVMSPRLLLAEGCRAVAVIETWRADTDAWSLGGKPRAVAGTFLDGESNGARAKNGTPVCFLGTAATTLAGAAAL